MCMNAVSILNPKAANLLSAGEHVQGQICLHTCYWNKSNMGHRTIFGTSLTSSSYSCILVSEWGGAGEEQGEKD